MRRFATSVVALAGLLVPAGAQAAAPTAVTGVATSVQAVSAQLNGSVNPGGLATTYRFAYVDADTYLVSRFAAAATTTAGSAGSGSSARAAAAAVSGLQPSTKYRFQLIATNGAGTSEGEAGEFTTPGSSPEPAPIECEADACQSLPSEPVDPPLTTLTPGAANPPVHFFNTTRHKPVYHRLRHHHHRGGSHGKRSRGGKKRR